MKWCSDECWRCVTRRARRNYVTIGSVLNGRICSKRQGRAGQGMIRQTGQDKCGAEEQDMICTTDKAAQDRTGQITARRQNRVR